jgi:hypothetical protein
VYDFVMATALTHPIESTDKLPPETDEAFAAEMRAKGYKQVTRWVLDLSNPTVLSEYKRQRAVLNEHYRTHPDELIELTEDDVEGWV